MDLDALEALYGKATPGEWENSRGFVRARTAVDGKMDGSIKVTLSCTWVAETLHGEGYVPGNGNADYIATLHNAFPELLALARKGQQSEKDAARYRWLREPQEHTCVEVENENEDGYTNTFYSAIRDELDAFIDAAIEKEKGRG